MCVCGCVWYVLVCVCVYVCVVHVCVLKIFSVGTKKELHNRNITEQSICASVYVVCAPVSVCGMYVPELVAHEKERHQCSSRDVQSLPRMVFGSV